MKELLVKKLVIVNYSSFTKLGKKRKRNFITNNNVYK